MTIRHLKELVAQLEREGVKDYTPIYTEADSCNDADEIIIATKDSKTIIYISDESPRLIEELQADGYTIKELY